MPSGLGGLGSASSPKTNGTAGVAAGTTIADGWRAVADDNYLGQAHLALPPSAGNGKSILCASSKICPFPDGRGAS